MKLFDWFRRMKTEPSDQRVHDLLNEVQKDVLRTKLKMDKATSIHSKRMDDAKDELESIAAKIAQVTGAPTRGYKQEKHTH
jgi:hypothetical protein